MRINRNNTQLQLLQESANSATLKEKLNNFQIQPGQGLTRIDSILAGVEIDRCHRFATYSTSRIYDRLRPIPFGKGTVLSAGGVLAWKCSCGHRWVNASQEKKISIWHCENCQIARLARRQKTDSELIAELLIIPDLKGWEQLFAREMQRKERLGTSQREKLQAIAQRLGIRLEENCSLSEVDGGEA